MVDNFTNFGGILSGPVALLGFIFRTILLTSLTDALAKWNEPFCERFSSIKFIFECLLYESVIRFSILLSVNDGLMASSFERILPEMF